MRSSSGITLIELLIAAAILVVLLATLGGMYVSSTRAYETNQAITEASGQLRTAVQAIQRDFSQAGYTGRAVSAAFDPLDVDFGELIEAESGFRREVQGLSVRYMESADDTVPIEVTYRVDDGVLMRQVDGGTVLPLAEGVLSLEATGFVTDSGSATPMQPALPGIANIRGLTFRLTYMQAGAERIEEFTVTRP